MPGGTPIGDLPEREPRDRPAKGAKGAAKGAPKGKGKDFSATPTRGLEAGQRVEFSLGYNVRTWETKAVCVKVLTEDGTGRASSDSPQQGGAAPSS